MQKTSLICSLLTGFTLSVAMVGCEPTKTATKPAGKTATSGAGSTTGGGTEVPSAAPSSGAAESPKSEAKPTEDKPVEEKPAGDAPKTEDAPKD